LRNAGLHNYEVSAWAREGAACRHNLNYWEYGDFVGVGAGAHGKLTIAAEGTIRRRIRRRHPRDWMEGAERGEGIADDRPIEPADRVFEFFLNQLRLIDGVRKDQFEPRTGVAWDEVSGPVSQAIEKGLLKDENGVLAPTDLGWRFSNEIQALFLP